MKNEFYKSLMSVTSLILVFGIFFHFWGMIYYSSLCLEIGFDFTSLDFNPIYVSFTAALILLNNITMLIKILASFFIVFALFMLLDKFIVKNPLLLSMENQVKPFALVTLFSFMLISLSIFYNEGKIDAKAVMQEMYSKKYDKGYHIFLITQSNQATNGIRHIMCGRKSCAGIEIPEIAIDDNVKTFRSRIVNYQPTDFFSPIDISR